MKRLTIILLALMANIMVFAQEDRFTNYSQLQGQDVILYDVSSIFISNGKFIYLDDNGKLKALKIDELPLVSNSLRMKHVENVTIKKKDYLHFVVNEGIHLYLLVNQKKSSFISKFRNVSYWEQYLEKNKLKKEYIYIDKILSSEPDKYYKVEWKGGTVPMQSIDEEVVFTYRLGDSTSDSSMKYSDFSNPTRFLFKTEDEYTEAVKKEKLIQEQLEAERCRKDSIPLVAVCKERVDYGSNSWEYIAVDDTAYIFWANGANIRMIYKDEEISSTIDNFEILDNEQFSFLISRGITNIDTRKNIATTLGLEYQKRQNQELDQFIASMIKESEAEEKEARSKKLFYEGKEYSYGDYGDFGLKISIYNCFSKVIKYVEFTAIPYNIVDDVQSDYVGRRFAKKTGIGPVEVGESATWDFNNMFYDKNDVIHRVEISNIKFTFKDGTTAVYSGTSNINKHMK